MGAEQRAHLPKNPDPVPARAFSGVAPPGAASPRQPISQSWARWLEARRGGRREDSESSYGAFEFPASHWVDGWMNVTPHS